LPEHRVVPGYLCAHPRCADHLHLFVDETECLVGKPAPVLVAQEMRVLFGDRHAIDMVHRNDEEADRMDRGHGAGGQHRTLSTLLAAPGHECAHVLEIAEFRLVLGRLGADGKGISDLRDDDADLAGGNLHDRMTRDGKERPQLEAQPGGEQIGLIARLAVEGDRAAAPQPLETEALPHQADFGRADVPERHEHDDDHHCHGDDGDPVFAPRGGEDLADEVHVIGPFLSLKDALPECVNATLRTTFGKCDVVATCGRRGDGLVFPAPKQRSAVRRKRHASRGKRPPRPS
jgi:hypothetical protein